GVLDTARIGELARSAQAEYAAEEKALRFQRMLTDITTRADASLPVKYIVDGRDHVIPLFLAGIVACGITAVIAFVATMQASILYPAVVLWIIVVVQVSIALLVTPPTLFGHWKD